MAAEGSGWQTSGRMIQDITHEAILDHPPEQVWKAITTPALLRTWLMENDFAGPTVGHTFEFRDRPRPFWDGRCKCEVIEADEPRCFALRWGIGGQNPPSVVSWMLEPEGEGRTRVRFRHGELTGLMGWFMKKGMDRGWRCMLERSLPYVLGRVAREETPTREQVLAVFACKG